MAKQEKKDLRFQVKLRLSLGETEQEIIERLTRTTSYKLTTIKNYIKALKK